MFLLNLEPTVPEGVLKPSKVQTMSKSVLDIEATQSGSEPGPEPSEARMGSTPFFLDRLDETFINLDGVEDLEVTNSDRPDSTIEVVPP